MHILDGVCMRSFAQSDMPGPNGNSNAGTVIDAHSQGHGVSEEDCLGQFFNLSGNSRNPCPTQFLSLIPLMATHMALNKSGIRSYWPDFRD